MRILPRVMEATGVLAALMEVALTAGAAQQRPSESDKDSLNDLLQRAGRYIAFYERKVPAIVADENYLQRFIVEPSTDVRHLRSDLLTIRDEAEGWIGFRDVYEVDGRAVRDRTDRLAKLFIEPHPDSRTQAKRIADESARFNIAGQVPRTINTPLLALQFIRLENQGRSTFAEAGTKIIGGSKVRMVDFQERATPRIIWTIDGAAARGRFWIEPGSGRITETELFVNTALDGGPRPRALAARIHVTYAEQQQLHLSVPVSMDETYQGVGLIVGNASYSNFRRFNVTTNETIKKDP